MKTLYVTYCSGRKHSISEGSPKHLYDSKRIRKFIEICESRRYDYAILSAKYGLFFADEVHKNYNVTFRSVAYDCRIVENEVLKSKDDSHKHFRFLVQQIRKLIQDNGFEKIIFYCRPPLKWRKCYLKALHAGADDCHIDHMKWDELLGHVKEESKIRIVTVMKNL